MSEVMSQKGLKTNLQRVSKDFCTYSTSHGVHHLSAREKFTPALFFWGLVFIVTIVGSSVHLYSLVLTYLEYDYYELITHDSEESLQFPHVSICDPNPISVFMINKYIEENMQILSKTILMSRKAYEYAADNENMNMDIRIYINRLVSMESQFANLPSGQKYISSFSIEELIVGCFYQGLRCGYKNFTRYLHPKYGNCYTFKLTNVDPSLGNTVGPENGLSLILRSQESNEVDPVYELFTKL